MRSVASHLLGIPVLDFLTCSLPNFQVSNFSLPKFMNFEKLGLICFVVPCHDEWYTIEVFQKSEDGRGWRLEGSATTLVSII